MNGFVMLFFSIDSQGRKRSLLYRFEIFGVPKILAETETFRKEILDEADQDQTPEFPFPRVKRLFLKRSLLLCPRSTILQPETSAVFTMSRINMFTESFLTKIADSFSEFLMTSLRRTLENRGSPPAVTDEG